MFVANQKRTDTHNMISLFLLDNEWLPYTCSNLRLTSKLIKEILPIIYKFECSAMLNITSYLGKFELDQPDTGKHPI